MELELEEEVQRVDRAVLDDDPPLTLKEIDALHATDSRRLGDVETALAAARHQYAFETQRGRFGTDAAHAASFAEYLPALAAAERAAHDAGEIAERNARQALGQLRAAASQPTLSAADMAAAAARQSLVVGEVARLDWPALRDRIQRAALADDRPSLYCYLELLPARLEKGDDAGEGLPGEGAARDEVASLLLPLRDRLRNRSFERQIGQLETTLGEAIDLRLSADRRAREMEAYSFIPAGAVRIPDEWA